MKQILGRASVVLAAMFVGGIAHAECNGAGCWEVYIEELYPEASGGAWIQTSGTETLANCTADSGIFLRLDGTMPGFKEVYATLLAAQLADKKVHVRIVEGTNPCRVWYVRLVRQ